MGDFLDGSLGEFLRLISKDPKQANRRPRRLLGDESPLSSPGGFSSAHLPQAVLQVTATSLGADLVAVAVLAAHPSQLPPPHGTTGGEEHGAGRETDSRLQSSPHLPPRPAATSGDWVAGRPLLGASSPPPTPLQGQALAASPASQPSSSTASHFAPSSSQGGADASRPHPTPYPLSGDVATHSGHPSFSSSFLQHPPLSASPSTVLPWDPGVAGPTSVWPSLVPPSPSFPSPSSTSPPSPSPSPSNLPALPPVMEEGNGETHSPPVSPPHSAGSEREATARGTNTPSNPGGNSRQSLSSRSPTTDRESLTPQPAAAAAGFLEGGCRSRPAFRPVDILLCSPKTRFSDMMYFPAHMLSSLDGKVASTEGWELPGAFGEALGQRPQAFQGLLFRLEEFDAFLFALWKDRKCVKPAAEKIMAAAATSMPLLMANRMSARKSETMGRQFDAILKRMPQAVVFVDDELAQVVVNPAAAELLKLPSFGEVDPVVVARAMRQLAERSGSRGDLQRWYSIVTGVTDSVIEEEWELKEPRRVLRVQSYPVSLDATAAQTNGRLWLFEDLTAERDAMAAIDAANKAKSQFLAMMSHELRTPMTGVLGMLELLKLTRMEREQLGLLKVMQSSAEGLMTVINNILDFCKMEAERLLLEDIPFSPADVLAQVQAAFEALAEEKGLTLSVQAPDLGDPVSGDPVRLKQVLANLLSNAVQFTEGGGVSVVWQALDGPPANVPTAGAAAPLDKAASAPVGLWGKEHRRDMHHVAAHPMAGLPPGHWAAAQQGQPGRAVSWSHEEMGGLGLRAYPGSRRSSRASSQSSTPLASSPPNQSSDGRSGLDQAGAHSGAGAGPAMPAFSPTSMRSTSPPAAAYVGQPVLRSHSWNVPSDHHRNRGNTSMEGSPSGPMPGAPGLEWVGRSLSTGVGGSPARSERGAGRQLFGFGAAGTPLPSATRDCSCGREPPPVALPGRQPLMCPLCGGLARVPGERGVRTDAAVPGPGLRPPAGLADVAGFGADSSGASASPVDMDCAQSGDEDAAQGRGESDAGAAAGGDGCEEVAEKEDTRQWFRVSVADTGCGIPKERLWKIFQASRGADLLRAGGTGLGLPICKGLLDLMGGSIWAESSLGIGSTFTFVVPLNKAEQPHAATAGAMAPAERMPGSGKQAPGTAPSPAEDAGDGGPVPELEKGPLTVLVAEDNKVNQLLIKRILKHYGHTVELVGNGRLALEAVQTKEYDMVLMDLQMPILDGLSATRAIRLLDMPCKSIPIYALTADILAPNIEDAGMDGYLSKPIVWEKISGVINTIQAKKAASRAKTAMIE